MLMNTFCAMDDLKPKLAVVIQTITLQFKKSHIVSSAITEHQTSSDSASL